MDIANFSIEILTFLYFVGVVAGFLDTLVGGGGLLAVPALLLSGIPPIYVPVSYTHLTLPTSDLV